MECQGNEERVFVCQVTVQKGNKKKHNDWSRIYGASQVANQKKVGHLVKNWIDQSHPNDNKTKGGKYNDDDINVEVDDRNDEVVQYGGVEVNNNLKAVLSLNPKMMTYSKISKENVEVEIEKAIVKQRYEQMSVDKDEHENEEELDPVVDLEGKRINYSALRATQIPSNPH